MPRASADLSPELRARYGLGPVARWKWVLGAAVAALLVGGGIVLFWPAANPDVTSQVLTFRVDSAHLVQLTFEVDRPADRTAFCALRAQDVDQQDVGYATVTIPPGSASVRGTYPLATRDTATIADVLGCSLDVPPVRVPPPDFPPGTTNPSQQPTFGGS